MRFFDALKARTTNFRYSIWHSKKIGFEIIRPVYASVRFCALFLFDAVYRNQLLAYIKYKKHYHQLYSTTLVNRYPSLFTICKQYFKDKDRENVKILSFGCSTGEEVYSIHQFMPDAVIIGTDINPYNIKLCNKKEKKANISFVHSLSQEYKQSKDFDAVFCLAVLQDYRNQAGCEIATKYTFSKFEKQLMALDEKLKVGGLLFIDQSDFIFMESKVSNKYSPLDVPGNRTTIKRSLFNSKNHKISDENNSLRVFLKKS